MDFVKYLSTDATSELSLYYKDFITRFIIKYLPLLAYNRDKSSADNKITFEQNLLLENLKKKFASFKSNKNTNYLPSFYKY